MQGDPNLWSAIVGARSPEVWGALLAGALYVYRRSQHPSRFSRAIEAGISCLLAYSIGPDASEWTGVNEAIVVILIASSGFLALDVVTSIVADRAVIKEILIKRLGGK